MLEADLLDIRLLEWVRTASKWQRAESDHRRGPKTVPAQTTEVMSFSLFSLDFKPKVLVVMLFLW